MGWRFERMSGEDGGLPDSPAAAVLARRESRTPIPERLREAAREDDQTRSTSRKRRSSTTRTWMRTRTTTVVVRGRVRLHGAAKLPSGLEVDDDRCSSLAERKWVRSVVREKTEKTTIDGKPRTAAS